MRIQYLKTLVDGNVTTRKGTVVDIDEWKAKDLISTGYVVHLPEPEESVAAPIAFLAANDNKDDEPFPLLQVGGRDGLEKPALSSRADQVPQKRKSTKRAAKQKS